MTVLRDELQTDPLEIGYAGMTDAEVAAALNARVRRGRRPVPAVEVERWAALYPDSEHTSVYGRLQARLRTSTDAAEIGLLATIFALIGVGKGDWDMDHPIVVARMAQAVAGGVMSGAEVDALSALADVMVSRSEQLIGRPALPNEVTAALYSDDGVRRL